MRRLALPAIFTARKTGFSIKAGLVSFTLILTAICGVAGYFKEDLLRDEFHRIAVAQGFTPRIIEITGRNHTDKQDIAAIANQMKGKSILAIDLMAMREDILQLGWVEDVESFCIFWILVKTRRTCKRANKKWIATGVDFGICLIFEYCDYIDKQINCRQFSLHECDLNWEQ